MLNVQLCRARAQLRKTNSYSRSMRSGCLNASQRTAYPRRYGVLLHPTSLPSPHPIGDLGEGARKFITWLEHAGASSWQILPLVPPGSGWSPYSTWAAFLGNSLLISLEDLVENDLLSECDLPNIVTNCSYVDYDASIALKQPLLDKAARALLDGKGSSEYLSAFSLMNVSGNDWLRNAALFHLLESDFGHSWWNWPHKFRSGDSEALETFERENEEKIKEFVAQQTIFHVQWKLLKNFANSKGISIIGDLPIYVSHHSADVWCNRHLFELKIDGTPRRVAGCPPDAFSPTGQYWGSPLYDWTSHSKSNFSWWIERMKRSLEMYDEVRIDHFRGFAGYWAIDFPSTSAISGKWQAGPHVSLFDAMKSAICERDCALPIIAEDLGDISSDVHDLRDSVGLPGIRVLQFGYGHDPQNIHLSYNYNDKTICYPATHDNDTCIGFFQSCKDETWTSMRELYKLSNYDVGVGVCNISSRLIEDALSSNSSCAIITMQDILYLGSESRMNTPSIAEGNWLWRADPQDMSLKVALHLRTLANQYGRLK